MTRAVVTGSTVPATAISGGVPAPGRSVANVILDLIPRRLRSESVPRAGSPPQGPAKPANQPFRTRSGRGNVPVPAALKRAKSQRDDGYHPFARWAGRAFAP